MEDIHVEFTEENFNKERDNFVKEENERHKNNKKFGEIKRSKEEDFPSDSDIETAINRAKNDLMVRTLGKRGINSKGESFTDSEKFEDLRKKIKCYFKGDKKNKDAFNKWHHEVCECVLQTMGNYYDKTRLKYGKAQKMINMTYKYLYCMAPDSYKGYFEHCHMPIDSIVLKWVKQEMKKEKEKEKGKDKKKGEDMCAFEVCKLPRWSNIQYSDQKKDDEINGKYTYNKLYEDIMMILDDNQVKLTPLQAEFVIWPKFR